MHARRCLPLVLSFVSGTAFPAAGAAPRVLDVALSHPTFLGSPNTLMVEAVVTVDDVADDVLHDATVGYVLAGDYVACDGTTPWKYSTDVQRFDDSDTRRWTLYNFVPEVPYRYVVRTGSGGAYRYSCGRLPSVSLPAPLASLNFQYEAAGPAHAFETRYVLLNLDDCGGTRGARANLFVLDAVNESMVWYLDMAAMTGLPDATVTGWRYQPARDSAPERILAIIDRRYVYEWGFDGTLRNFQDLATGGECDGTTDARGPCAHHDVLTDDAGATYLLSSRASPMPTAGTDWAACSSRFINDGFRVLDADFEPVDAYYLMTDYGYDPRVDGGPHARPVDAPASDACSANTWRPYLGDVVDWTHANSIDRTTDGSREVLDLSVRGWDQIVRLDAGDGSYLWSLASDPDYSDWRLRMAPGIEGRRAFSGQHDVHTVAPDTLLMLDNLGDPRVSRVLRLSLGASSVATIDRSWALVDSAGRPLDCPVEGSAQEVPGTSGEHVLASCNDAFAVVELDDPSGYPTSYTIEPPLVISLPDGTSDDFCTSGGPSRRDMLRGFYRAFPLETVGSFE
jgi:hypothetical protein